MKCFVVLIFCTLQLIFKVSAEGYYTVIAPGTLLSHSKYSVAIAVHDTDGPSIITVGIVGPSLNTTEIIKFNQKSDIRKRDFILPDLDVGTYKLIVTGEGSLNFFNATKLNYKRYDPNIFIQTDKGAYRPGDVVQFRVLFLDQYLRPIRIEDLKSEASVFIEDSNGIRVRQFRQLDIQKGVFTGKFELSQYAGLGTWRISVKLYENVVFGSKTANFDVIEYVLPKFEVTLSASNRVSVVDGIVVVDVNARYTYGKAVNGNTVIIAELKHQSFHVNTTPIIVKSTSMDDGRSKLEFSVEAYKNIVTSGAAILKITAIVEENYTGIKLNATSLTTLFSTRFTIYCKSSETCNTYTPQKAQNVSYEIRNVDGSLVEKPNSKVRLIYTEQQNPNETHEFEAELIANVSIVTFNVKDLPDLNQGNYYVVDIEVDGEKQRVDRVYPEHKYTTGLYENDVYSGNNITEWKNYLKIELKGKIIQNKKATALVKSGQGLKYFVYIIMGSGNILEAKRIVPDEKALITEVKFKVTIDMVPEAKIYVHYMESGSYFYDELKFKVEWKNKNKINISLPDKVDVGKNVTIKVKTLPDSFVGLMAIDQNVLYYQDNNDLTAGDLNSKLKVFTSTTPKQEGSPYPGTVSGVVTLTNGHYESRKKTKPKNTLRSSLSLRRNYPIRLMKTASNEKSFHPIIRENFAETWIFDNIENTSNGSFELVRKIPDTVTAWLLTGFSINEEHGIAISHPPQNITAFQPFFITVRLPEFIRRGEVFAVRALVFNYLNKDLHVTVTLFNLNNDFTFVNPSNDPEQATSMAFSLAVPRNSSKEVSFWISPKALGNILLKLKAVSDIAGDAIHKSIKVIPEGITLYESQAYLVNVEKNQHQKGTFNLSAKVENYINDSLRAELSVGDIMGPLLSRLITLTDAPTPVGENTISMFVTNIQLIRYLKEIKKPGKKISRLITKLIKNLERSYQTLLRSRLSNGAFNTVPDIGSTWVTAYVLRYIFQARAYIYIDPKIFEYGLKYIASQYDGVGTFAEDGAMLYSKLNSTLWVTANVVLTLLDHPVFSHQMTDQALSYLYGHLNEDNDLLAKAIAIYAVQKSGNSAYRISTQFSELERLAISDKDLMWWEYESKMYDPHWELRRKDLNVVLTSYAFLSLLDRSKDVADVNNLRIVKYLIGQRYKEGRFADDLDTAISTEALIEFARQTGYANKIQKLKFNIKTQGKTSNVEEKLSIDFENAMEMQSIQLPDDTQKVEFDANGDGSALVQVLYQYNSKDDLTSPSFNVNFDVLDSPKGRNNMSICVRNTDPNHNITELVAMEVTLPSGFEADTKTFPEILQMKSVKLVDATNHNTVIRIFFENFKKNEQQCVNIQSVKVFEIFQPNSVPIVVYDYYNRSKKTIIFYRKTLDLSVLNPRNKIMSHLAAYRKCLPLN